MQVAADFSCVCPSSVSSSSDSVLPISFLRPYFASKESAFRFEFDFMEICVDNLL